MFTELTPEFDSRKSFYGKAKIFHSDTNVYTKYLYSYGTLVAMVDTEDYEVELYQYWDYSATTLRHVREFLKQNGFTADSKAQMAREYPAHSTPLSLAQLGV